SRGLPGRCTTSTRRVVPRPGGVVGARVRRSMRSWSSPSYARWREPCSRHRAVVWTGSALRLAGVVRGLDVRRHLGGVDVALDQVGGLGDEDVVETGDGPVRVPGELAALTGQQLGETGRDELAHRLRHPALLGRDRDAAE